MDDVDDGREVEYYGMLDDAIGNSVIRVSEGE